MVTQHNTARYRLSWGAQAGLATVLLCVVGCNTHRDDFKQFLRSQEHTVSAGDYRVAPPDVISLHSPIAPEIDGAVRRVRPDGKIALRLLGEVYVAGLTPREISQKVTRLLARYYVEPEVVVDVASFASQYHYVFGEVLSPGPKRSTGRDTLLTVLADARPNKFAWRSQIKVTRPGTPDEDPATLVINLDEMIKTGDSRQDVLIQPGDIIEVPPTPLAWVGHQVRAVLYPVEPIYNAYVYPADFLEANDTYNERNNDDNDDNFSLRRTLLNR